MKLRILQISVLLAGCLGLFFVCFPDCVSSLKNRECEQIHFRSAGLQYENTIPVQIDSVSVKQDSIARI